MPNDSLFDEFLSAVGHSSDLAVQLRFDKAGLVDCDLPDSASEPLAYRLILDVPVFARIGVDGNFGVLSFEPGMPYIAERHLPTSPFVRISI